MYNLGIKERKWFKHKMEKFVKKYLLNKNGKYKSQITEKYLTENNILEEYKSLKNKYPQLKMCEIVRCVIENNGSDRCQICSNKLYKIKQVNPFICKKCGVNIGLEKRKITNIERYGDENPNTNEDIKEKRKRTTLERYGVEHTSQSNEIKNKIKNTNLKKYGTEYPSKNKEIQEKIKNTSLERYGKTSYLATEECQQKAKTHISENKEKILKKKQVTSLKNYNEIHPMKNKEFKEKIKKTNMEKYGVDWFFQTENFNEKYVYQTYYDNLSNIGKYYFDNQEKILEIYNERKLNICDLSDIVEIHPVKLARMFHENNWKIENRKVSSEEKHFKMRLEDDLNLTITNNDRTIISPYEIDIAILDKNVGVEYHGLYWHSTNDYENVYYKHKDKLVLAKNNGVKLLQFFSNEVNQKYEIVKSIISESIDLNEKIYANNCIIKEIDDNIYSEFCDKNYLLENRNTTFNLGLYNGNELVSVMSFNKITNNNWKIEIFCNKLNIKVIDGEIKLFNYFVKKYNPNSVSGYVNARISDGKFLERLGFEFIEHTEPNYYCTDGVNIYNPENIKILEKYDETKSEKQNIVDNGYRIIYDAGYLVYCFFNSG